MKVYFETYGCAANKSDTEIMMGILSRASFQLVDSPEKSDLNIINTCIVKTPTANRMKRRIQELYKIGKPLIVAGCMPKAEREIVEKIAPKASLIGPNSVGNILNVAKLTLEGGKVIDLDSFYEKPSLPKTDLNKVISIVQISTGCLSACSFCEARIARGILRSFRPSSIIESVKKAIEAGKKEVWITSQDNACYGFDIGTNLGELIKAITKIEGEFLIRVGMMNPCHLIKRREVLEEIISAFESEKVFKFIHLPLQSGSDKVLKDMNRGYTFSEFEEIVKLFRKNFPEITLETDIIVGYPTESEEDFEKTVEAIKKIEPDVVNISRFSSRPNTPASKLKKLDEKTVMKRSKILHELVTEIALRKNEKYVGRKFKVLIDEIGKENSLLARTFNYKQVVLKANDNLLGSFVDVKIEEALSHFLKATII